MTRFFCGVFYSFCFVFGYVCELFSELAGFLFGCYCSVVL